MLIFVAAVSLVILVVGGVALYIWLNRKSYTRERFAFVSLALIGSIVLVVTGSLLQGTTPWEAVLAVISPLLFGTQYEVSSVKFSDGALCVILIFGFSWFVFKIHQQWDGKLSESNRRLKENQQPTTIGVLFDESRAFYRDWRKLEKIQEHTAMVESSVRPLKGGESSLVWKDQAFDLIKLRPEGKEYKFNSASWHERQKCWIGHHKHTQEVVMLACWKTTPENSELIKAMEYVKKIHANDVEKYGLEFIVAIRQGRLSEILNVEKQPVLLISESKILDSLVDFSSYWEHIKYSVEDKSLEGLELSICDMYTEASFHKAGEVKSNDNIEKYLREWLEEKSQRQFALLGEYGQGKSTTSLMLTYHLLKEYQKNRNTRIPIIIELRGKSPRTLTPTQLLELWAGPYGIDARALKKLLIDGRLLLIFEGFDEVDLSGDSEGRLRHFKTMWDLCYSKAKILITGRPNFFLDDQELKAALGIQDKKTGQAYCEAIYLSRFDVDQIRYSLRKVDENIRKEICNLADSDPKFREIVSRPSLLFIVSSLWESEKFIEREHISSALVMDLFIQHSYRRQGAKAINGPNFMALNNAERGYFMQGIAAYMASKSLPNQISGADLNQVIRDLIRIIPDSVSADNTIITGEVRQPLRERFDFANLGHEAVQHIQTDVRACGLLVNDVSKNGYLKFAHKSFLEFLIAKSFSEQQLSKDRLLGLENAASSSIYNHNKLHKVDVLDSKESLSFASELLVSPFQDMNLDQDRLSEKLFNIVFEQNSLPNKIRFILLKGPAKLIGKLYEQRKIRHLELVTLSLIAFFTFSPLFLKGETLEGIANLTLAILTDFLIVAFLYMFFGLNKMFYKGFNLGSEGSYWKLILATSMAFSAFTISDVVVDLINPINRFGSLAILYATFCGFALMFITLCVLVLCSLNSTIRGPLYANFNLWYQTTEVLGFDKSIRHRYWGEGISDLFKTFKKS